MGRFGTENGLPVSIANKLASKTVEKKTHKIYCNNYIKDMLAN